MYGVVGTDGVVYGPVPVAALFEWIAQGRVVPTTTLIDYQGRPLMAAAVPELQGAFPMPTQPYAPGYPRPDAAFYAPPTKRKSVALLLAFLLGFLGAHRFYLGHTGSGLAMLALNVAALAFVTDWQMAILIEVVATIWLIADMAMIGAGKLVGTDGRPLG